MSDLPTFGEAFRTFARIGVLSFGGPAAQIGLMHRVLVDEKRWLSEPQYLSALSFCMLLPGPEAMQLATYAGWRLHGVRGGLMAGLMFVLPGACLVLALAMIYAAFGNVPLIQALFLGVKAAVVVIVIEALLRIGKRALKSTAHRVLAGLSFVAIFFFSLPFPLVIAVAALAGAMLAWRRGGGAAPVTTSVRVRPWATVATVLIWLAVWAAPLAAIALVLGPDHVLAEIGLFFSKLAVVTFGGAYAVLAYMAQEVVQLYGWLSPGEMIDGLGLAETTNGPLILVTEFVGYLAAHHSVAGQGGSTVLMAVLMGAAGAAVALWATFAPCFLWIFAGAPYIERLQHAPRLTGALSGVMAAVVGVVLNLTVWFALHVFFAEVTLEEVGPLTLWTPDVETVDWLAVVLAVLAGVALLRFHLGLAWTLALSAVLGLAWSQVG